QIEMSSIRRILFNQSGKEDDRIISLVLILDAPPKLQVQRKNGKEFGPWEFRTELQRGNYPGERSDKETLNYSKAISLVFDTCKMKERMRDGNSSIDSFFYDIISRLRHITGKAVEFSDLFEDLAIEGEVRREISDYYYGCQRVDKMTQSRSSLEAWPFFDETVCELLYDAAERLVYTTGIIGTQEEAAKGLVEWKEFRVRALLQGILDRGMEYRIELLCSKKTWHHFINMVVDRYANDEQRALYSLERVMLLISEGRPSCSISLLFMKEWDSYTPQRRSMQFNEEEIKEGYCRIMKFVATPTRVLFIGYEVIMGNRVMNKYARNENHIIRVTFRDDRGGFLRVGDYIPEVRKRIKGFLLNGITYAGRTFVWLGNSNSQLRDQGCYMMHVDFQDRSSKWLLPQDIHVQMGFFHDLPNIPKMLARLGQVFTQCKPSEIAISASDIGVTADLTGGRNAAGKPYVFSDGVGLISAAHATKLSDEHEISGIACAFQIRFRGEKGLLCMDPLIDEKNELLEMMGRKEEQKKVFIRPSMSKFQVMEEDSYGLEIVKPSASTAVFLNRPFINILCQVSESQSPECHRRVKDRVIDLMHTMLRDCFQAQFNEHKAADVIRETWFPVNMEILTHTTGINLTSDPFFRALLRVHAKYVILKQLKKMNIRIPTANGRLMFGVVDTTGLLQYGQVFCQYSGSTSNQTGISRSTEGKSGIVLTGPTLITKNPCHSSGDVRMFEAVDIIGLRHLMDVIVFPMHGPRPHPDEMAGSDLDGDEYLVIWDEALFLERSEEAAVFPIGEEKKKWAIPTDENGAVDFEKCEQKKAEFFTEAIVFGQSGALSVAHLATSDLYGLDSKPAKSLAMKIAQTLDYQKSGIKPEKMTRKTIVDPDDPCRVIPGERPKLRPDYLMKFGEPAYQSRGILGELFRETCKYEAAFECGAKQLESIDRVDSFLISGWEDYECTIQDELAAYTHALRCVLEQHGIGSEEELLSGLLITLNRLSEHEEHDGSLFTTNRVIGQKGRRIIEKARERFFKDLINWREDLEELENKRSDVGSGSILNMRARSYTQNMVNIRKKASAAYSVAYEAADKSGKRGEQCAILLSFPWIFYDVLADIKHRPDPGMLPEEAGILRANEPLADELSDFIDRYCEDPANEGRFDEFMTRFDEEETILARSIKENTGLSRAAFVLVEWANHVGGLGERFGEEHLLSLFILFGLGEVVSRGQRRRLLQKPTGEMRDHPTKGVHLLYFLDYIASNEFRMRPTLSFTELDGGLLMRGEWQAFSETSLKSFLSLVTTHCLDLPSENNRECGGAVREWEPRVMQLPASVITHNLKDVQWALEKVSGCQVNIRIICTELVMVSAVGRSDQLRILATFVYPPAPPRAIATLKGVIKSMAANTYERLMSAVISIE
ncbi:hypothetical protein PMAYCL1PPCAC_21160, partial [Pristionchus mayeri]